MFRPPKTKAVNSSALIEVSIYCLRCLPVCPLTPLPPPLGLFVCCFVSPGVRVSLCSLAVLEVTMETNYPLIHWDLLAAAFSVLGLMVRAPCLPRSFTHSVCPAILWALAAFTPCSAWGHGRREADSISVFSVIVSGPCTSDCRVLFF